MQILNLPKEKTRQNSFSSMQFLLSIRMSLSRSKTVLKDVDGKLHQLLPRKIYHRCPLLQKFKHEATEKHESMEANQEKVAVNNKHATAHCKNHLGHKNIQKSQAQCKDYCYPWKSKVYDILGSFYKFHDWNLGPSRLLHIGFQCNIMLHEEQKRTSVMDNAQDPCWPHLKNTILFVVAYKACMNRSAQSGPHCLLNYDKKSKINWLTSLCIGEMLHEMKINRTHPSKTEWNVPRKTWYSSNLLWAQSRIATSYKLCYGVRWQSIWWEVLLYLNQPMECGPYPLISCQVSRAHLKGFLVYSWFLDRTYVIAHLSGTQ